MRRPILLALAIASLSACSTVYRQVPFPEPPDYLVQCARENPVEIPDLPEGDSQLVGWWAELAARMRASELGFKRCADAWAAWSEGLRE